MRPLGRREMPASFRLLEAQAGGLHLFLQAGGGRRFQCCERDLGSTEADRGSLAVSERRRCEGGRAPGQGNTEETGQEPADCE